MIIGNNAFVCQNLSDSECTISFRSVLFSEYTFYLVRMSLIWRDLGKWLPCIGTSTRRVYRNGRMVRRGSSLKNCAFPH